MKIDYAHTSNKNLFLVNSTSYIDELIIDNCEINNNSTSQTDFIEQQSGVLRFNNNKYTLANYAGVNINLTGGDCFADNNEIVGAGTSCVAGFTGNEVVANNNIFSGSFDSIGFGGVTTNASLVNATVNSYIGFTADSKNTNIYAPGIQIRDSGNNIYHENCTYGSDFGDTVTNITYINCVWTAAYSHSSAGGCSGRLYQGCEFRNTVAIGANRARFDFVNCQFDNTASIGGTDCNILGNYFAAAVSVGTRANFQGNRTATNISVTLSGVDCIVTGNTLGTTSAGSANFVDNGATETNVLDNNYFEAAIGGTAVGTRHSAANYILT